MKEFNRMGKKAWKAFSRAIRARKDKSAYFCGQLFDEQQWFAIYTGLKNYGVEVSPLYEYKSGYIHCCRVLYQLAESEEERKQNMKDAKEWWANRKA